MTLGCGVRLDETSAIVMGSSQRNTYIYSIGREEWSLGPMVGVSHRRTQACGLVEDLSDFSIKYVILTGSLDIRTEVLQVDGTGISAWTRGQDFPSRLNWGSHLASTPDGKSLVLSGGIQGQNTQAEKQLYRIQCNNGPAGCLWDRLHIDMEYPRHWHTTVFLPESEYPCNPTTKPCCRSNLPSIYFEIIVV